MSARLTFSLTFTLITPHCIYIVPPAPEVTVSVLIFEVCVSVEYHLAALTFEISYDF